MFKVVDPYHCHCLFNQFRRTDRFADFAGLAGFIGRLDEFSTVTGIRIRWKLHVFLRISCEMVVQHVGSS